MVAKKRTFGPKKTSVSKKKSNVAKKKSVKKNLNASKKKSNTISKKVSKKNVSKKASPKKNVSKDVVLSKKLQKNIVANKKVNDAQDKEIEKLKDTIFGLKKKKKTNSRRISEYNLFIRKQIKAGLTFEKAVKEWNKFKKLESKQKRKPSAYNQFIGSQMKLGKTFMESVRLWKLAKAGKLGKKGTNKTITRTVVKRIVSKPKIVVKRIKSKPEIVVKKVQSKPKVVEKIKYRTRIIRSKEPITKIVEKQGIDYNKLKEMFSSIASTINSSSTRVESVSVKDIKKVVEADDEEIAFKIVQTYFIEIARFGFKKQLTLDEIINAYIYALARVKRKESVDLSKSVRDAGLTR